MLNRWPGPVLVSTSGRERVSCPSIADMEFGSALSTLADTGPALGEALTLAAAPLVNAPDVVLCFASPHHLDDVGTVAKRAHAIVAPGGTSMGVVAEGVIGGPREADVGPGLALWVASLPGAAWRSSHLEAMRTPDGLAVGGWEEPDDPCGAILLSDPYSFPAGPFAKRLGDRGLRVAGGLANGGGGPGRGALFRDGAVHRSGAVSLAFGGGIEFRTVVSQGCRPVGEPAIVTASNGTTILQIGGKPALEFLQDLMDTLEPEDQRLVRGGLQLGVAVDEYRTDFGRGDFLIRGVVGADPDSGSLSVGETVPVGRTVQFQVRDPGGADADLRSLLSVEPTGSGVLIFSCNGRGSRFFGRPNHDAAVVGEVLEPMAVAGFFAAGEIGPIGGENHLHGFTASIVELRPLA